MNLPIEICALINDNLANVCPFSKRKKSILHAGVLKERNGYVVFPNMKLADGLGFTIRSGFTIQITWRIWPWGYEQSWRTVILVETPGHRARDYFWRDKHPSEEIDLWLKWVELYAFWGCEKSLKY